MRPARNPAAIPTTCDEYGCVAFERVVILEHRVLPVHDVVEIMHFVRDRASAAPNPAPSQRVHGRADEHDRHQRAVQTEAARIAPQRRPQLQTQYRCRQTAISTHETHAETHHAVPLAAHQTAQRDGEEHQPQLRRPPGSTPSPAPRSRRSRRSRRRPASRSARSASRRYSIRQRIVVVDEHAAAVAANARRARSCRERRSSRRRPRRRVVSPPPVSAYDPSANVCSRRRRRNTAESRRSERADRPRTRCRASRSSVDAVSNPRMKRAEQTRRSAPAASDAPAAAANAQCGTVDVRGVRPLARLSKNDRTRRLPALQKRRRSLRALRCATARSACRRRSAAAPRSSANTVDPVTRLAKT